MMHPWIESCETWISRQYRTTLGVSPTETQVVLRWLGKESLTDEVTKDSAEAMAIEDAEIGWLLFLIPYEQESLEQQISQSLSVRSRLLTESNYSGNEEPTDKEDADSSWRLGLIWLVEDSKWLTWQRQVLELRRESGAAEEISLDGIRITDNAIADSLDSHGLPRLLLNTRALLKRSPADAEIWLSADSQVSADFKDFSTRFQATRSRELARQIEKLIDAFRPIDGRKLPSKPRQLSRFQVKHFRNLDAMELATDSDDTSFAQAIILFGPNGTGKSGIMHLTHAGFYERIRLP